MSKYFYGKLNLKSLFFVLMLIVVLDSTTLVNSQYLKSKISSQGASNLKLNSEFLKSSKPKKTKEKPCFKDTHSPYGKESRNMRYAGIIALILTSLIALIFRLVISLFVNKLSTFNINTIKEVSLTNFIYFFCFSLFFLVFTFSGFDKLKTNLENFFLGALIFMLIWILMGIATVFLYNSYIRFLRKFDSNNLTFKQLKVNYEKIINQRYCVDHRSISNTYHNRTAYESQKNVDIKGIEADLEKIFEEYEYLVMKQFFISPLVPIFKPYTLRQDFNFGAYLRYCLVENISNFFNFTWTSLVFLLIGIMLWSSLIHPYTYSVSLFSDFLYYFRQFLWFSFQYS